MNRTSLDGLQRAATVLLQMGPDRAGRVLKGMSEAEVMAIAGAITALPALDARTVAEFYDPADVLSWVTDALTERYPHVDFTAVYE